MEVIIKIHKIEGIYHQEILIHQINIQEDLVMVLYHQGGSSHQMERKRRRENNL